MSQSLAQTSHEGSRNVNKILSKLAVVAALAAGGANAFAQAGPSFLGSFSPLPGQPSSIAIGNTLSAANGLLATDSVTQWNFTDVYTFSTSPATASVNTISFEYVPGITNIQIALFAGSPTGFATPGTYNNSIGSLTGAVAGGGWASNQFSSGPGFNVVTLSNVSLNPGGSFTLEIRGAAPVLTGSATASYSGNLLLSAVPEPETYALFFAGLLTMGLALQKRARD
jgi:hypothetical protein